jgi:hypothetical protein
MPGDEEDRELEVELVVDMVVVNDDGRGEHYPHRDDCCGRNPWTACRRRRRLLGSTDGLREGVFLVVGAVAEALLASKVDVFLAFMVSGKGNVLGI